MLKLWTACTQSEGAQELTDGIQYEAVTCMTGRQLLCKHKVPHKAIRNIAEIQCCSRCDCRNRASLGCHCTLSALRCFFSNPKVETHNTCRLPCSSVRMNHPPVHLGPHQSLYAAASFLSSHAHRPACTWSGLHARTTWNVNQ